MSGPFSSPFAGGGPPGSGTGGSFLIDDDHFFVDNNSRDSYFTSNPDERETGTLISVDGLYQQWNGASWVDKTAIVRGPSGDDAIGDPGLDGLDGWTPVLAIVQDTDRRILQVINWISTGTPSQPKPVTGQYVSSTGLSNNIALAIDIRGAQGNPGIDGVDPNNKGYFVDYASIISSYPAGTDGWFCINGTTDTVWIWSSTITDWIDTGATGQVVSLNGLTGVISLISGSGISISTSAGQIIIASSVSDFDNPLPTPITVGGISAGSTFSNVPLDTMFDLLLYPELFPTLTNPSSTFTSSITGFREIGESINITFNSAFNRGSINPAYGTSGYRSGLPDEYVYTGTDLINNLSVLLTDSATVTAYVVLQGNQTWSGRVSYTIGEQPLSSKGNDYDSPLAPGMTNAINRTITGVYPVFATSTDITTLTKQSLVSMTSAYFEVDLVAEGGSDKQKIDVPDIWAGITGIQFYNTISSTWDWLSGSKVNSLNSFGTSAVTHVLYGNTINYTRYTHTGSLIGSRKLRFRTD